MLGKVPHCAHWSSTALMPIHAIVVGNNSPLQALHTCVNRVQPANAAPEYDAMVFLISSACTLGKVPECAPWSSGTLVPIHPMFAKKNSVSQALHTCTTPTEPANAAPELKALTFIIGWQKKKKKKKKKQRKKKTPPVA